MSVSAQDISDSKEKLTRLQQRLTELDIEQGNELDKCDKQMLEKGEFETTAQFERREKEKEDRCWNLRVQIWDQQGKDRQQIYREMNRILTTEYESSVALDIGTYNADRQTFDISYRGSPLTTIHVPLGTAKKFKEAFASSKATARLGLHLNVRSEATEYLISAKVSVLGKEYIWGREALSIGDAMYLMYGNYDSSLKRSSWQLGVINEFGGPGDQILYARLVKVIDYIQKGVPKRLVITKTPPEEEGYSCHACAMYVGIGVFAKEPNGWRLQQVKKRAMWEGSWGDVEGPSFVKIGPDRYALRFDSYDMGQGYETGLTSFFEIAEDSINLILYLRTHESNVAAISTVRNMLLKDVKVSFRPGANTEYYDAIFNITGKAPKKIGRRYVLAPYARSEVHPFSGSEYYQDGAP
jgi:hypothetical protein